MLILYYLYKQAAFNGFIATGSYIANYIRDDAGVGTNVYGLGPLY